MSAVTEGVDTTGRTGPAGDGSMLRFGVATAGFQVEGGYNGPGQPANNWLAWEQVGRIEPSGRAVGFFDDPDAALSRAAGLGCDVFRLGVEWARVVPAEGAVDHAALDRYVEIVRACGDRGLEPMVTLHHFTHPAHLGEDFWLRPDAPERFREWCELAVDALGDDVRLWVTVNEPNVLALGSWVLGRFPPGRVGAFEDALVAADHLLAAHVLAYEVVHRARPDACVTTNSMALSCYELDRLFTDVLLARAAGVDRCDLPSWLDGRRHTHDSLLPACDLRERAARRLLAARWCPLGRRGEVPFRRALDAVYEAPGDRALDLLGVDLYAPTVSRHARLPLHRTAGGRQALPTRALWDDEPDPGGLARWLSIEHARAPELPIWVIENGLCNRVRNGRSHPRLDGWDRPRYLRAHVAAVLDAIAAGTPVAGYLHWSLVDNYEWGSYEPRFGLFGVDRHHGDRAFTWLEHDSMGDDAAGTYREVIAKVRSGGRAPGDRR